MFYRLLLLATLVVSLTACDALDQLRDVREVIEETENAGTPAEVLRQPSGGADLFLDGGRVQPDAGVNDTGITVTRDAGRDAADVGFDDVFAPDAGDDAEVAPPEAPPIVDFLSPRFVSTEGGEIVAIEGANFDIETEVLVDGVAVEWLDLIDEFTLLFRTPPLEAGEHTVKVANAIGTADALGGLVAIAPLRVLGVSPAVLPSAARAVFEVEGAGFSEETRFLVAGREASVDGRSGDDRVTLVAPLALDPGFYAVEAFDAQHAILRDAIEVTVPPTLSQLAPSVADYRGGSVVRLVARGVDDGCVLVSNARALPLSVDAAGVATVELPGGALGFQDVTLDCGDRGAALLLDAFEYVESVGDGPLSVWPNVGYTRGSTLVTIAGTGLETTAAATFGGRGASVVRAGGFGVDVLTPLSPVGLVDVVVVTDAGRSTIEDAFEYVEQPLFLGLEPNVVAPDGGAPVFLRGEALQSVTELRVDGVAVAFEVVDGGLRFVAPPGLPGLASVAVSIGGLSLQPGFDLRYARDLRFDELFPLRAATNGGTRVFIAGDGFTDDCQVLVDGVVAEHEVLGSSLLAIAAPRHPEGAAEVRVTGCGDWVSPQPLLYFDPAIGVGGVGGGGLNGELYVTVIEGGTGLPIERATVQVGIRDTEALIALTDEFGRASFIDPALVGPHTVTAFALNRSTESYVDVDASSVTMILAQLPPPPDVGEGPPGPLPGTIIGFLTGLRKATDPPPGARLAAYIETTRLAPGFPNPDPGPGSRLLEDGPFTITARLGEMALVASCGWEDELTLEFTPRSLGVVRGIQIRESDGPVRLAVECDIPLSEAATFKITDAPALAEDPLMFPSRFLAIPTLDFGGEGVFESLPTVESTESLFTAGAYPLFEGVLSDVRIDFTAGAYPANGIVPSSSTYLRGLSRLDRVLSFPGLLDVPDFLHPSFEDPVIRDGYIEWAVDPATRTPDLYYLSISSANPGFSRWAVYVPGDQTSINLADFPGSYEGIGVVPRPGIPLDTINIYVRALDLDVFDFDEFDRYVLRARNWRAASLNFVSELLDNPNTGDF